MPYIRAYITQVRWASREADRSRGALDKQGGQRTTGKQSRAENKQRHKQEADQRDQNQRRETEQRAGARARLKTLPSRN